MMNDIGSLLERSPELRGGRPRIAGTGLTVHRIATWYKMGYSPEEIAAEYDHISIAHVYAALAYYHANQEQIEAEIAADDAEADQFEQEYLQRRK